METGPDVASSPSYSVGEGENNIAESAITAEEEGIRVGGKKRRRGADSLFPDRRVVRTDRPAVLGENYMVLLFFLFPSSAFSPHSPQNDSFQTERQRTDDTHDNFFS